LSSEISVRPGFLTLNGIIFRPVAEEQALKAGMEQKAREFVEKGAEIYSKA
jgi:hypothetical protein